MSFKELARNWVPKRIKAWRNRRLATGELLWAVKPLHPRSCPICDYHGFFLHYGRPPRLDARCPSCGALERHRLFWLWFGGDPAKLQEPLLHFAPEPLLERRFREVYHSYTTASINNSADLRLDIENIDLPDGSFNTVICNHVLEHVADSRALEEIYRVLSDEGRLVASVPIIEGWDHTYEDADVKDSVARELHFGQGDHVRYYGRDFRDRLHNAGFKKIEEITAEGRSVVDHALQRGEKIFLCSKS